MQAYCAYISVEFLLIKEKFDIELPPQMGREINEISRWKLNFEHKIDYEGVKVVYYDL